MNKKTLFSLLGIVIIAGIGIYLWKTNDTSKPAPIQTLPEGSTITQTTEATINVYTSRSLGVTFKYPLIDPYYANVAAKEGVELKETQTVKEEGNTISVSGTSIVVHQKDPSSSIRTAIQNILGAPHCEVSVQGNRAFVPDLIQSSWNNVCGKEVAEKFSDKRNQPHGVPAYFIFSNEQTDRIVAVHLSEQEPSGALSYSEDGVLTTWPETVELMAL